MEIKTDETSFVNVEAVGRGLARRVPNKAWVWATPEANTRLMDALAARFDIHQYEAAKHDMEHYKSDWDLFFWCGDLYLQTNGRKEGRDMSCVSLNFNDRRTPEKRDADAAALLSFLSDWPQNGIRGAELSYRSETVAEAARAFLTSVCAARTPVEWSGKIGEIRYKRGFSWTGYYFWPKGARKYGRTIENWNAALHIRPVEAVRPETARTSKSDEAQIRLAI